MNRHARVLFAALLLVMATAAADAQTPAPTPEVDVGDLVRAWRHKEPRPAAEPGQPMIVAAPIIGSNPSAGFLVGAAAQMAVYRGDPSTTRITSGIASFSISTRKQLLFNLRFDTYSDGNRWFIKGDNRFQDTSQDTYGFGTATPASAAVTADYNFIRVHETAYRQVAKDIYVGGGFLFDSHTSVEPNEDAEPGWSASPYVIYSQQHGLPLDSQQSAGLSLNLLLNRRDDDINARRGWRVDARYRTSFDGFLGADSSWQALDVDARAYLSLDRGRRQRLAFWSYASVTDGVAPYFDGPSTVMDTYGRSARGYQEGRYRGEQLVYAETEYRAPLMRSGLLGMVAFATMTTVSDRASGEALFDAVAPSAGGGLRLLLSKQSRTNLCVDVAWGKAGASGVYLAIQEAF